MNGTPFDRSVGVFHIDTGHGGVSVDGDVGRDNFVEELWALFHPHRANWRGLVMLRTFLVRSLAVALQTSRLMTCPMAKGRTPPLGLVAGTIRAARYVPRISVGTSAVASLQKASHTQSHGSPSNSVIQVQCSYLPPPGPVALLEGENLMAKQELAEEALLVFFSEGRVSVLPVCVLGSG